VDDTDDRVVAVEEGNTRHALRKLLRHFDQLDTVLDRKGAHLPVSDIESIAWAKTRIADCGQLLTHRNDVG